MRSLSRVAEDRIREFLREDVGYGDITSDALIEDDLRAIGRLFFREAGVAAGLEEAAAVFRLLGCDVKLIREDGGRVKANEVLMEIIGPAKALLAGERTALNIVGRMAGIATAVADMRSRAARVDPHTRIAATRKTAPGLRDFDKKAVELGGGDTHRLRLDDCVLIKDNHLALTPSITEAVRRARLNVSFTKKIEVEVGGLEQAEEAANANADIIMFDNMAPEEIKRCLRHLSERGLREGLLFEASGGITAENVEEYSGTGVDVISMGSLTHSAKGLDAKLGIEILKK